jgi:hypothetical protein
MLSGRYLFSLTGPWGQPPQAALQIAARLCSTSTARKADFAVRVVSVLYTAYAYMFAVVFPCIMHIPVAPVTVLPLTACHIVAAYTHHALAGQTHG